MNSILYKGVCFTLLALTLWNLSLNVSRSAPPIPPFDAPNSGNLTYLPQVGNETCPPFIEDFSNTDNGWLEGGIFVQEFGYTNQEYYLRLLAPNFNGGVPVPLPCSSTNIHAEITGRWLTEAGAGFGIQFGPTLTSTAYYDFQVNPDSGTYYVLERTAAGTSVFVPETPTSALEAGQPALLEVNVVNGVALLSINGVALEEFIYLYEGPFQLRLSIASKPTQSELPIEARFDNMNVYIP